MYFTDTPELRKFEREMRQSPNFDKRNDDCDKTDDARSLDNKNFYTDEKKMEINFMTIKIRKGDFIRTEQNTI